MIRQDCDVYKSNIFSLFVSEIQEVNGLDSSWSHSGAVGVLVTGSRRAGVLQAAAAVRQDVKAGKTLAVRLNEKQQLHTGLLVIILMI